MKTEASPSSKIMLNKPLQGGAFLPVSLGSQKQSGKIPGTNMDEFQQTL